MSFTGTGSEPSSDSIEVPLVEPRSRTDTPAAVTASSTCRREQLASVRRISQSTPRPTVAVPRGSAHTIPASGPPTTCSRRIARATRSGRPGRSTPRADPERSPGPPSSAASGSGWVPDHSDGLLSASSGWACRRDARTALRRCVRTSPTVVPNGPRTSTSHAEPLVPRRVSRVRIRVIVGQRPRFWCRLWTAHWLSTGHEHGAFRAASPTYGAPCQYRTGRPIERQGGSARIAREDS